MRSVQHAIPYLPLHWRQAEEPALNQVLLRQLQSRVLVPGTEALPTVILPVLTPDRLAKLPWTHSPGIYILLSLLRTAWPQPAMVCGQKISYALLHKDLGCSFNDVIPEFTNCLKSIFLISFPCPV